MLKATVTYSTQFIDFRRLEIEFWALESSLLKEKGMQVQFQMRNVQTGDATIFCKGLLDGYSSWSESPVALALRALHTLYTDWHLSVPSELKTQNVASMQIVIQYEVNTIRNTVLSSISLTRDPGTKEMYQVLRTVDSDAAWPLQITSESAVPLGVALKLLAFENSSPIDFSAFPPSPQVTVHTDEDRRRVVQLAELPDYAIPAFQTYIAGKGTHRKGDAAIPIGRWQSFLRS
jgi:hypothetical protein